MMKEYQKTTLKSKRGRKMTEAEWEFATDEYKELRKGRKMKATQFKEYRDTITEGKFPKGLIAKALKIAKKSSGQMTKAWKQIEKIKKGLGDDPTVADALKQANEETTEERDYRKEYDNYQGTPDQIARRSSRNKARRVMGDDCEEGKDVGHKDNDPMNNDRDNLRNEDPSKNRREPRLRKEAGGENKKLLKKYKKNEDGNAHSENYLLLAKAFGNPKEVKEVEAILKRNKKQGHTSEKDNKWMYKTINPYYKKLVSAAKNESFSGYREAENLPEVLEFGTDETTKNYKDKTPGEANEAKAKYKIDHKTYSSAVDEALKVADKQGYEVDMDDYFNKIATGPRKPQEGKTNIFKIALEKGQKEQKKKLQIQIYGKGKHGYELNCYIQ